jgi:hypothetical protein
MKIVRNTVEAIRKVGETLSAADDASEVVPAGTDLLQKGAMAVILGPSASPAKQIYHTTLQAGSNSGPASNRCHAP